MDTFHGRFCIHQGPYYTAIVVDFDINSPVGIIVVEVVDLVYKGDLEYACSASLLDTLSDKSDCVVAVIIGGIKIDLSSSWSALTCVLYCPVSMTCVKS